MLAHRISAHVSCGKSAVRKTESPDSGSEMMSAVSMDAAVAFWSPTLKVFPTTDLRYSDTDGLNAAAICEPLSVAMGRSCEFN